MPPHTPETLARAQIDAGIVAAGWVNQDYKAVEFSAIRGATDRTYLEKYFQEYCLSMSLHEGEIPRATLFPRLAAALWPQSSKRIFSLSEPAAA